jgi:hypothetical protein
MNALKHMELIFGVVVVAGCVAAALPDNAGGQAQLKAVAATIPVVVVKGKRLSALEKRQLSRADTGAGHDAMNGSGT